MKIAFRVDASEEIGSGHAIRCLTLANVLRGRGAQTCFLGTVRLDHVERRITESGHQLIALPSGSGAPDTDLAHAAWLGRSRSVDASLCQTAIERFRPQWLVVDHYALEAEWERQMATVAERIMVIDDLADRQHAATLLLDQNFRRTYEGRYADLVPRDCTLLLGPQYALLQPEYAKLRPTARIREKIGRILIYFGGGDAEGQLSVASLQAVHTVFPFAGVDLVYPYNNLEVWSRLRSFSDGKPEIRLHQTLPSLASLMAAADLTIGAVGASSWERLCLGLPAVTIVCADNQREVATELEAAGLIVGAGSKAAIDPDGLVAVLKKIECTGLVAWSRRCLSICDGQGAEVVADYMYIQSNPEVI